MVKPAAPTRRKKPDARSTRTALEAALRAWGGLFDLVPAGLVACDRDGNVVRANRRAAEIWERTPKRGEAWARFCASAGLVPQAELPLLDVLRTRRPVRGRESLLTRKDGRRATLLVSIEPLFDRKRRLIGALVCNQDISEQKAAQTALEERDRRHAEVLDALPAAIYTTDAQGRITFYNKAAVELAGRAPALGTDEWCVTWRLYRPDGQPLPHDECPMAVALKENRAVRGIEAVAERPDGTRVPFRPYPTPLRDGEGNLVGAVNMLVDVSAYKAAETERHRLVAELTALNATLEERVAERTRALLAEGEERRVVEAQLHQLQKTEALGHLTGGIAHDFNNLLTAVIGNLDMIAARSRDEQVGKHAHSAIRAAQRGATLTQQLLAFSRKQRLDPKPTGVNELVSGMGEMLVRTLGGTVRVELALGRDLWPALVDTNQIESAILNLAINSRDAMPAGGTVTIETANVRVEKSTRIARLEPGDYVMIAVADTGTGMDRDIQAKAFDPFFTTKEVGKGSGLGLSQVYGVARQSGGTAELESVAGQGTVVRLYLPRAGSGVTAELNADAPPAETAATRPARVLVIDDDADVREVLLLWLRRFGYVADGVNSAADGLAALGRGGYDLVVMDFAMPEMNGATAAKLVHERWPDLPVLHVSGYPARPELEGDAKTIVLQKPFVAADLGEKVRLLLEHRAAARSSNVVPLRQGTGTN